MIHVQTLEEEAALLQYLHICTHPDKNYERPDNTDTNDPVFHMLFIGDKIYKLRRLLFQYDSQGARNTLWGVINKYSG